MIENKTAVITGGAQGIGRIMADTLLQEGWNVAVWDNDEVALEQEEKRLKGEKNRIGLNCNVACAGSVNISLMETLKKFGRIDLLVNNAAIHANKPISQLEISEFRRVIDVNLTGSFICAKTCEEELRKTKGSIINICSTRAFQSEANTEAYSASKGGIFALTHSLAVSLGSEIRVNCISPGWIDVSAVRKSQTAKQEQLSEADHKQHPAGRVGVAGDIARMVLFLANEENSFITAQNFVVDGGMTRKMIYV
jgi:NAD(P)-dependent dehydrogenase (short-subunit alcohol dehydrogenase family)